MKGLKTVSVVDALTTSLRSRVLDGQIDAGVGLTETDVATEYEVSRPTAKTAISQLVQEGLLRREAHKSAHVPSLSREDVEDLFLVRMPLELEVVRLVSGTGDPAGAAGSGRGTGRDRPRGRAQQVRRGRPAVPPRAGPRGGQPPADPALPGAQRRDPPVDGAIPVRARPGPDRRRARRGAGGAAGRRRRQAESLMRAHLEGARDALAEQFDSIDHRSTAP